MIAQVDLKALMQALAARSINEVHVEAGFNSMDRSWERVWQTNCSLFRAEFAR